MPGTEPPPRGPGGARGAILRQLATDGAASRAELADRTGLAPTTVTSAVTRLAADGLIRELPRDVSTRGAGLGRPASLLALTEQPGPVGAVLVAHHTLHAAVVSAQGVVLARHAVPLPDEDRDEVVEHGAALLDRAARDCDLRAAGLSAAVVGLPAPFLPGRGIASLRPAARRPGDPPDATPGCPPGMSGDPTGAFAERLGIPVLVDNDANLAALGETDFGAARGLSHVVYLKVLPGIGAGVVVDDRLVRGAAGFAGELAHLQVREDGPLCTCGGRGCLITVASSRTLVELVRPAYDRDLSFDDIIAMSAQAEHGVHRILADLGRTLGRYLSTIAIFLNPEVIVVDGTLGPAAAPLIHGLHERIERDIPQTVARTLRIVPGTLHDSAELAGAAALARREGLVPAPPVGTRRPH